MLRLWIAVALLTLGACQSKDEKPSPGDRMILSGGEAARWGDQWNRAEDMLQEAYDDRREAREKIDDGEELVREGQDQLEEAEETIEKAKRLKREAEEKSGQH